MTDHLEQPLRITSQPEPEHLATATLALARVLAGDIDVDTRLAVGAALAELSDVTPPYPPHPEDLEPKPAEQGIRDALAALDRALDAATGVAEAVRIGLGARELTTHLRTTGQPWPASDDGTELP